LGSAGTNTDIEEPTMTATQTEEAKAAAGYTLAIDSETTRRIETKQFATRNEVEDFLGADVIYQINTRETTGPDDQEYEAPGRGIVTAIEVGPYITTITVHCKRHDGTGRDVTLIEGTDVIEWPEGTEPESEAEYRDPQSGTAWDCDYDGYPGAV
jgi:hypothetical protein